jgi:hypothetical protein
MKKKSTTLNNFLLLLVTLILTPFISWSQTVADNMQTVLSPGSVNPTTPASASVTGNLSLNDIGAASFYYGTPVEGLGGTASTNYTLNSDSNGAISFNTDKAGMYFFDVPVTTAAGIVTTPLTITVDGPVEDLVTLQLTNRLSGGFEAKINGNLAINDINPLNTYATAIVGNDGVAGVYTLTINPDGTYFFDGHAAGMYHFEVPVTTLLGVINTALRITVNGPIGDTIGLTNKTVSTIVGNVSANDMGGPYVYGTPITGNNGVPGSYNMNMGTDGQFTFTASAVGIYNLEIPVTTDSGILFTPLAINVTAPLPISLVNFNARLVQNVVELDWTTALEKNAAYFSVQRSVDGLHFEEIGTLEAEENSTIEQSYSFTDIDIMTNRQNNSSVLYRLELFDKDNTSQLSETVAINLSTTVDDITMFPNPTQGQIKITNWEEIDKLTIINSFGQVIYSDKAVSGPIVNINGNSTGVYHVIIETLQGELRTSKLQLIK